MTDHSDPPPRACRVHLAVAAVVARPHGSARPVEGNHLIGWSTPRALSTPGPASDVPVDEHARPGAAVGHRADEIVSDRAWPRDGARPGRSHESHDDELGAVA